MLRLSPCRFLCQLPLFPLVIISKSHAVKRTNVHTFGESDQQGKEALMPLGSRILATGIRRKSTRLWRNICPLQKEREVGRIPGEQK